MSLNGNFQILKCDVTSLTTLILNVKQKTFLSLLQSLNVNKPWGFAFAVAQCELTLSSSLGALLSPDSFMTQWLSERKTKVSCQMRKLLLFETISTKAVSEKQIIFKKCVLYATNLRYRRLFNWMVTKPGVDLHNQISNVCPCGTIFLSFQFSGIFGRIIGSRPLWVWLPLWEILDPPLEMVWEPWPFNQTCTVLYSVMLLTLSTYNIDHKKKTSRKYIGIL